MDPAHRGWPPQPGGNEQNQSQASRPPFGAGQQSPPQGHNGLNAPPPSGPFPHFHQQQPTLANLAGISQSSPRQPPRPEPPSQQLPLPGFSQATGQPGAAERERERAREVETHIKQEEEDRRHREQQERQRFEQAPPHQTQPGPPVHLHQPVAVGPRSAVHGPNGLLANPGQPQPSLGLGAPNGPGSIFPGGPVPPNAQPQGPVQQMQPAMLMPLPPGAPQQAQQQQQQASQQGQGQGQQPILNDALSYLDQVKVQFSDHPDVYNRFLDIMKDFKSGAIDTPGVIGRVSSLFAGNPELIQGFNTFLPPGYRIECGPDTSSIRVTTPMGSRIHPMPQPARSHPDDTSMQDGLRPPNGTSTPQPGQFASRALSPSGRGMAGQPPQPGSVEAARQQEHQQQQVMHQQEQRGVSSLQNAVSAATGGAALRAGVSPRGTPLPGQQDPNPMDGATLQIPSEKRGGPVEFNHAISYVNKIKNRFASQPDIYKQFLEILQTYQRESKPIQDVYSQVTILFDGAPDLLQDFKQFLPESAAQAKAAENARRQAEEGVLFSNVRGEPAFQSPILSRETQMATPSHGRSNLPPVGNFAPTPVSKDNNKKRKDRQGNIGSTIDITAGPATGRGGAYAGQPPKRQKQTHQPGPRMTDIPPSSPSLIPRLPEPLPPTTTSAATSDELQFFDRVKKVIGNKNTMNEFLKTCNLFSQDLIDTTTLAHRAKNFFGANQELIKYFYEFLGYEEKDVVIENKAREAVPGGRVSLSNCRGMGPSYRLLPKRERSKKCSGRDELCHSVLNDEWASHPTWASEDSGFIAHRKNLHEEGLHRIEEERHDYDYNIEACGRTIQLLEPIAQQLLRMSTEEQKAFKLPPGLGGQSEAIWQRVVMKLYGRDRGQEVIQALQETPYQVIPVLLNRLKERQETWKLAQREWEKVWREQTQKMFWKSLDHQAANTRVNDRRQFQTKALQNEISTRFEEMKASEDKTKSGLLRGKPQAELQITDLDVMVDATWLLLVHIRSQDSADSPRLEPFVREFVPMFIGVEPDVFERKLAERSSGTPINGEAVHGDDGLSGAEDSAGEKRGRKNGKNTLLRQTLDKGSRGKFGRKDREDSNTSISRASTPDIASNAGEETTADTVNPSGTPGPESSLAKASAANVHQRWFDHPVTETTEAKRLDPNEPQERHTFRLWANTPIFCFVRMLMHLYERLHNLKQSEAECKEMVKHAKKNKPATDLGINDKLPQDFFADISPSANFYKQVLSKFVSVLEGELDFVTDGVEDCLRRFYLQSGYPLYAFEKMIQALWRYGVQMVNQDSGNKEKSWDILQLWKKDRVKAETSAVQSTDYRKAAEKLIGNGETYRVEWDDETKTVKIFMVKKEDWFYVDDFPSERDLEDRWRYYIASYTSLEDTEGINKKNLSTVILSRNISALGIDPKVDTFPPFNYAADGEAQDSTTSAPEGDETGDNAGKRLLDRFLAARNDENLILRIALNGYTRVYSPGTAEGFYQDSAMRAGGQEGIKEADEAQGAREEEMKTKFEMNNSGMKDVSKEVVEKANEGWIGVVEGKEATQAEGEGMNVDE